MIATDFSVATPDAATREAMQKRVAEVAIAPEAIARGVAFAIEQPFRRGEHRHSSHGAGLTPLRTAAVQ